MDNEPKFLFAFYALKLDKKKTTPMAPKNRDAREKGDLIQLKPLERLNLVLEVDETARDLMHLMENLMKKRNEFFVFAT